MKIQLSAYLMTGLLGAAVCCAQGDTQSVPPNSQNPNAAQSSASSSSSPSTTESSESSSTGAIDSGESTHKMSAADRQYMKKCMEQAKKANDGMSEKDMRKSCHHQTMRHAAGEQKNPTTPQY